ncbi:MAG: peptidoglycan-binding protein [Candidatus Pacebacteria bacterium]|nr:peptidoglycan-binding protein [Candidatus Paceibacterota bacterium]
MSKIFSRLLVLAMVVWLSGSVLVGSVSAQATDISALLQQIANLQAQLLAMQSGSSVAMTSSCTFTRNLTVGDRGDDVTCLQTLLKSKGHLNYSATGYFGSLTKAAVSAWQSASGITPTSGYFGPKSRAVHAATAVSTPSVPGVTVTPVVTGQVTITPGTNVGGSVISGAAQIPVLNFKVSNGTNANVWVTGAKFAKTGVVSDSNITNAYLSMGSSIVAQYNSLSGGVVSFTGNLFEVPAGQTVDIWLRMDISTGASNGNTLAFALLNSSDITVSAGNLSGSFPISGGNFVTTSVSNPSLATVSTFTYTGVASTVDAGTLSFKAAAFTISVTNSPIKVTNVTLTNSGSINSATDIKNLMLMVDGKTVGTAATLGSNGKVTFDMASNAPILTTGTHVMELFVDVLGTPNRTVKFELLRPFDWTVIDTQYNSNISGGSPTGSATEVTVRAGTITGSTNITTPTGNIAKGSTNVTLAKFDFRAAGEAVRVKWLPFKLTFVGTGTIPTISAGYIDANVGAISLVGDDGAQVGTEIGTLSSCTYGTVEYGTGTYICSFGSSSSNVNYIIPANTTRVLSLKVEIPTTATSTSIKGSILAPSGTSGFTGSNIEGQVSFQTAAAPGGTLDGSALTVIASPFLGSQNTSFGPQTYVPGGQTRKIGSYSISASSAEGIEVSSLTVKTSADIGTIKIQNLRVKIGSTEWSYNVPTVALSTSYTFTSPGGTPTVIPAGSSVLFDVYGDVLSGSTVGTYTAPTSIVGAVGVGIITRSSQTLATTTAAVSTTLPIFGQNVVIAASGTLTATVDTSTPSAQQIVLGLTGVTLGQYRFTADNNEDIRVDTLRMTASTSAGSPATFYNLQFYDGANKIGPTGTALVASTTAFYISDFSFGSTMVVPKNTTKTYTLKGDVASFTNSTSSHNKFYQFTINSASTTPSLTGDIKAYGADSNTQVNATTSSSTQTLSSNIQTTLRTKLTPAFATLGATSNRTRQANDDIGTLTITADAGYGVELKSLQIKFSGAALSSPVPSGWSGVVLQLIDSDTAGVIMSTTSTMNATTTGIGMTLSTPFLVTQGTSKVFKLRLDSSNFTNAATVSDSLSWQLGSTSALTWASQGLSSSETLNLEERIIPITSTVSFE